jgi:hypothetical protein
VRSATRHLLNILLVQRFTAAVFHVGFPCSANLLNHAVRQGGVIQALACLPPFLYAQSKNFSTSAPCSGFFCSL